MLLVVVAWPRVKCWSSRKEAESLRLAVCPTAAFRCTVNYVYVWVVLLSIHYGVHLVNLAVWNDVTEIYLLFLSLLMEKVHHGWRWTRIYRGNHYLSKIFVKSRASFPLVVTDNHLDLWKVICLVLIVEIRYSLITRGFLSLYFPVACTHCLSHIASCLLFEVIFFLGLELYCNTRWLFLNFIFWLFNIQLDRSNCWKFCFKLSRG